MISSHCNFVHLFVDKPLESAQFYKKLFETQALIEAPTYVLLQLPGLKLGLWSFLTAEPDVSADPGSCEIVIVEKDIDKLYEKLQEQGIEFSQKPTTMNFGRTCVALDPDGHRLRFYSPSDTNA